MGTYCGVNVEGWLSKRIGRKSNPVLGAVIGGAGTNLLSDAGGMLSRSDYGRDASRCYSWVCASHAINPFN